MPELTAASPLKSVAGKAAALDHGAVELAEISGRSMVRVITHMDDVATAQAALPSAWPVAPLSSTPGDPAGLWLGPNQCLLVSDSLPAGALTRTTRSALEAVLCSVNDVSSALTVLSLDGPGTRSVLSGACGLDFRRDSFDTGHCASTRFAGVPLLIHRPVTGEGFMLYVDRSYAPYLWAWLIDR